MPNQFHIIYLPSWYPTADQPLNGVFCRDLASVLAEQTNLTVLHLRFNPALKFRVETEIAASEGQPHTLSIELPRHAGIFSGLWDQWEYYGELFRAVKKLRRPGVKQIVHTQVAWKCGFDAMLIRWRFRIPYLITEHFTGWLPEDGSMKGWKRWLSALALKRAATVAAVSGTLAASLKKVTGRNIEVIPNVVHKTFTTARVSDAPAAPVLLHISNFRNRHKQTDRIIRVFSRLAVHDDKTRLWLNVPEVEYNSFRQANPGLAWDRIDLLGPTVDRAQLAARMSQATALVTFSRFETFGLTLAEAACMGLPVICTPCGGADAWLIETMALKVDADDEDGLLQAMQEAVKKGKFDRHTIAGHGRTIFDNRGVVDSYLRIYHKLS